MARPRDWLVVPLLVVVAGVGIAWGTRATVRTMRNWSPQTMTCAEFLANPADADWVRLEGCEVTSSRVGIETSRPANAPAGSTGSTRAVYIPIGAGPRVGDGRVALVLRVDHGPIFRLGARYPSDRDTEDARAALAQPLEGLVERSLDRSERDRDKLRGLGLALADDFLIIDYEARPRPLWLGLGILGAGLGALALLVRKWRRRVRPARLARAKLVAG